MYRVALESDGRYSVTHYTKLHDVERPTIETILHHSHVYDAEQSAISRAARLSMVQDSPVTVETLTDRLIISVIVTPLNRQSVTKGDI